MAAPTVMLPVCEGCWLGGRYWVGDALQGFAEEAGDFDVVYCDVDKDGCPDCWRAVRDRIRVGGLWLCDNTIWSGYIATGTDREGLAGLPPSSGSTTGCWLRTPATWRHHPDSGRRDDRFADRITRA